MHLASTCLAFICISSSVQTCLRSVLFTPVAFFVNFSFLFVWILQFHGRLRSAVFFFHSIKEGRKMYVFKVCILSVFNLTLTLTKERRKMRLQSLPPASFKKSLMFLYKVYVIPLLINFTNVRPVDLVKSRGLADKWKTTCHMPGYFKLSLWLSEHIRKGYLHRRSRYIGIQSYMQMQRVQEVLQNQDGQKVGPEIGLTGIHLHNARFYL